MMQTELIKQLNQVLKPLLNIRITKDYKELRLLMILKK